MASRYMGAKHISEKFDKTNLISAVLTSAYSYGRENSLSRQSSAALKKGTNESTLASAKRKLNTSLTISATEPQSADNTTTSVQEPDSHERKLGGSGYSREQRSKTNCHRRSGHLDTQCNLRWVQESTYWSFWPNYYRSHSSGNMVSHTCSNFLPRSMSSRLCLRSARAWPRASPGIGRMHMTLRCISFGVHCLSRVARMARV